MLQLPSLNFALGDTIDTLRHSVQTFAAKEIAPRAAEIDKSDKFPMDLWRKFGDMGLLGITVEEDYGGAGMGYLAHIVAMEEISRASACDRGETTRKDAAGAILYAAEKATWMALEAIQCLGGNGYINDYPTGRLLRDAKLYEIGAGTSEIRRMLIGRELFAETA